LIKDFADKSEPSRKLLQKATSEENKKQKDIKRPDTGGATENQTTKELS
jgi:hypothetical protein